MCDLCNYFVKLRNAITLFKFTFTLRESHRNKNY